MIVDRVLIEQHHLKRNRTEEVTICANVQAIAFDHLQLVDMPKEVELPAQRLIWFMDKLQALTFHFDDYVGLDDLTTPRKDLDHLWRFVIPWQEDDFPVELIHILQTFQRPKIAEVIDRISPLDSGIPIGDQRRIHRCHIREGTARKFQRALMPKVSIGCEKSGHDLALGLFFFGAVCADTSLTRN